jgi:hypothetical protein
MLHTHHSAAVSQLRPTRLYVPSNRLFASRRARPTISSRGSAGEVPQPGPLLVLRDYLDPIGPVKFAQRHLVDAEMRLVKEDAAELHDAVGAHVDPWCQ